MDTYSISKTVSGTREALLSAPPGVPGLKMLETSARMIWKAHPGRRHQGAAN